MHASNSKRHGPDAPRLRQVRSRHHHKRTMHALRPPREPAQEPAPNHQRLPVPTLAHPPPGHPTHANPPAPAAKPATTVDHIMPFVDSTDPAAWDTMNLRAMCHRATDTKTDDAQQVRTAPQRAPHDYAPNHHAYAWGGRPPRRQAPSSQQPTCQTHFVREVELVGGPEPCLCIVMRRFGMRKPSSAARSWWRSGMSLAGRFWVRGGRRVGRWCRIR